MNSRDLSNFLCGAACGAAICALLLPKSGPQYREMVRSKAKDAAKKLRKGEDLLRERTSDIKASIDRKRTGIMDAVEAGREAYNRATTAAASLSQTH